MGFYPQPNKWQCGPFALKHALAILGRFVDEKELARKAKSTRTGTDEYMLARAAKTYEVSLKEIRKYDEDSAHTAITSYLQRNIPCLICINQWGHWVTVVSHHPRTDRFVVIDSEKDPVVRIPAWSELKRRWVYNEYDREGKLHKYYDFYPVQPKFRVQTKADFSLERARVLRRPGNASFVKHFDEYVTDMVDIVRPRSARLSVGATITMAEFLRRHRRMLVETVCYRHGHVSEAQLRRILNNMQFVAETYGLVVRQDEEKRTIAAVAAVLMIWATTHAPLQALYGED